MGDGEDPESNLAVINEMLQSCNYIVKVFKITALDYGTPQRRMRVFICGYHKEKQPNASLNRVEKLLNIMQLKSQQPDPFFNLRRE